MRNVAVKYRDSVPQRSICSWLGIAPSSLYYKPSATKRGRKPSRHTLKTDATVVENSVVVNTLIEEMYSQEFCRYGYQISTVELQEKGFVINHKKVYRLMGESGLLLQKVTTGKVHRNWVQWRTLRDVKPMEHICMDIKYVYIHGACRNAFLLAIMDISTRYVLAWSLRWNMKHTDVILCLHDALRNYQTHSITLRTDNGSQFIAHGFRKYVALKNITQQYTHVATPQENAYVESLFSCVEREVIQAYQFSSIYDAKQVFSRYFTHHNIKRKRHALGKKCPLDYWNTAFHFHPVKPPFALSEEFVKGDDSIKNQLNISSLVLPLTISERGLTLLDMDENITTLVPNPFNKTVQ